MAAADVQTAIGYHVDDRAERLSSVEATLNRVLSQSPNNALGALLDGQGAHPNQARGPGHCRM